MLQVRDAVRDVFRTQLADAAEETIAEARRHLNRTYDSFVARFGPLSARENVKAFAGDPDQPLLLSLEDFDPETKRANKTTVFERRTLERYRPVERVETASEALLVSLNETGEINWPRMESLTGRSASELQEELGSLTYCNPETGIWETADCYLSGNVRAKLAAAQDAMRGHPAYRRNVEALNTVQPKDLEPGEIEARLAKIAHYREPLRIANKPAPAQVDPISGSYGVWDRGKSGSTISRCDRPSARGALRQTDGGVADSLRRLLNPGHRGAGSPELLRLQEREQIRKLLVREIIRETVGHQRHRRGPYRAYFFARNAHPVARAADNQDRLRRSFSLHSRVDLLCSLDAINLVPRHKARTRIDHCLEQIEARANRADAGKIGPDVAALRHDRMATGTSCLLTEENVPAAIDVAAVKQRLERFQPRGSRFLRLGDARQQRLSGGLHGGGEVLQQLWNSLGRNAVNTLQRAEQSIDHRVADLGIV